MGYEWSLKICSARKMLKLVGVRWLVLRIPTSALVLGLSIIRENLTFFNFYEY